MRRPRKIRDDRFAPTTPQDPRSEVRTHAEPLHPAQRAYPNTLSAGQEGLPVVADQPILIGSRPLLEIAATH